MSRAEWLAGRSQPEVDRLLELRTAQAEALAAALLKCLAVVSRIGGYLPHEDIADVRAARALLAEVGL